MCSTILFLLNGKGTLKPPKSLFRYTGKGFSNTKHINSKLWIHSVKRISDCTNYFLKTYRYTLCYSTSIFSQKEGPPPGYYEPANLETKRAISSSFVSRTPRFSTSQTVSDNDLYF